MTYLHYPTDTITISYNYKFNSVKDYCNQLLKEYGLKIVGYGYDEKKQGYVFCVKNFEPLREIKKDLQLSEKQKGWHKDHYNYNKAESWEIKPAKRKIPARNYSKR